MSRLFPLCCVLVLGVVAPAFGDATVSMTPNDVCLKTGEPLHVALDLTGAAAPIVGGQFWIEYDPARLSYTPAADNPQPGATWPVLIYASHAAPVIFVSVGIANGDVGATAGHMVTLKFTALSEVCDTAGLVRFKSPDGQPPSRLADDQDNAVYPVKVDLPAVTIDSTPPALVCSAPSTIGTDPGVCEATYVAPAPSVADLCDGAPVLTGTRSDGRPLLAPFPIGITTIHWTATDCAGNVGECTHEITVADQEDPAFASVPPEVAVDADAGECSALVNVPWAAATDNCDASPLITFVRSDGQTTLAAPYPVGTTTITWTATDMAGNASNACTSVTVSGDNQVVVALELRGTAAGPFQRCITFEFNPGAVQVKQVVQFAAAPGGSRADNVLLRVPCSGGPYTCVRARDDLHSLWSAAVEPEAFYDGGTQYFADFTNDGGLDHRLVLGNLNQDEYVDVLDFAVYVTRFGLTMPVDLDCAYTLRHPDFDGSGLVDTVDFTVVQTYYLFEDQPGCSAGKTRSLPIQRISVLELRRRGLRELAVADLNADGWLDTLDLAAFANGVLPSLPPGDWSSGQFELEEESDVAAPAPISADKPLPLRRR